MWMLDRFLHGKGSEGGLMKFQTGYKLGTGDLCGLILEGGGGD